MAEVRTTSCLFVGWIVYFVSSLPFSSSSDLSITTITQQAEGHASHQHEERVLIYPKTTISIILDVPRAKQCYIVVKTKVLNDLITVGRTDSLESTDIEPIEFKSKIELTYYTGIDDNQMAIFEIMDGDILGSSAFGYLFYTVTVPVGDLFRGNLKIRLVRDKEHLGYLSLRTTMDITSEVVTVVAENKRSIAFFESAPPTDSVAREKHEKFTVPFGMYTIELLCRNVLDHEPAEILSDSVYIIAHMYLNVEEFPTEESPKWKFVDIFHARKLEIWSSLKNFKKPYDVNALEIKFSLQQLTGELLFKRVLSKKTQKKLKLIVEIHVGGTEGEMAPPIKISHCAFR